MLNVVVDVADVEPPRPPPAGPGPASRRSFVELHDDVRVVGNSVVVLVVGCVVVVVVVAAVVLDGLDVAVVGGGVGAGVGACVVVVAGGNVVVSSSGAPRNLASADASPPAGKDLPAKTRLRSLVTSCGLMSDVSGKYSFCICRNPSPTAK